MVPKKILSEIRKKRNRIFLVSAHIHLEGDALGSELALASMLASLGKKVIILNEDLWPKEYAFLPGIKYICHDTTPRDYDVAIILDCSDLSRIGKISKVIKRQKPILNIDHHISNTKFGSVNWVKPEASCTCEMVYELFKALKVKIKRPDALNLYTGILIDTGSFKYATTSSWTHLVTSELLKHKLDVYSIHRRINESLAFATVKSFAGIIETLSTDKSGKIAWLEVRNKLLKKNPSLKLETDGIIQFARSVEGVEVALLFKEISPRGEVRVNLRSRGKVDVNKLARVFGGGGHKMASGCTVKGRFRDVIERVVQETKKRLA